LGIPKPRKERLLGGGDNSVRVFLCLIQINKKTRCNSFSSLLLDVYVQFNMFRASLRPSSGAQQLQYQLLVLLLERGDSSAVGRGRAGINVK
jgi:hypothetical protein